MKTKDISVGNRAHRSFKLVICCFKGPTKNEALFYGDILPVRLVQVFSPKEEENMYLCKRPEWQTGQKSGVLSNNSLQEEILPSGKWKKDLFQSE